MKINSFSYWDVKYYLSRSLKSAAYVIFAISLGTLILVSVYNILTVPLSCLFDEVTRKLCQAGIVVGWVRPFGI